MKYLTSEEIGKLFAQELHTACDEAKIPPENKGRGSWLAKNLGVSKVTISKYFNGGAIPHSDTLTRLCEILRTDPSRFSFIYTKTPESIGDVKNFLRADRVIPLISWGNLLDLRSSSHYLKQKGVKTMFAISESTNDSCYGLPIESDSMQWSGSPSFQVGSIIIMDTSKAPENKSFVVFTQGEDYGFKQYIKDGGKSYLRSLNTSYPTTELTDDVKICGVAIQIVTNLP